MLALRYRSTLKTTAKVSRLPLSYIFPFNRVNFPDGTWVLLPLNVGNFAGARSRFVQLPFEVNPGDTILFNLLDDDSLTTEQEHTIVTGCRSAGYCVLVAGHIYCPQASLLARPAVLAAGDLLGQAIVQDISLHGFDNFGTAEYIVPKLLPAQPQQANELSVRSATNYVPVVLKLYGPTSAIQFSLDDGV